MAGDVMPDDPEQLRKELERYRLVVTELQGKISTLENEIATAATMAEIPAVVVTQPELRQTLSRLISKIAMILQAEKVLTLLYQADTGHLSVLPPALGITEEQISELLVTSDTGVSGKVFNSGEAIIYNDAINHPDTDKEIISLLRARNGLCVPLSIQQRDEDERVTGKKTIGVLHVMNKRFEQEFGTDDQRLAEMLGDQAAAVIANAQVFREVQKAKEQLEGAFESISAGVVVTGQFGDIRLMNHAARRMLNVNPETPLAGKKLADLTDARELLDRFDRAVQANGGETASEVTGPGDGRIYQSQFTLMRPSDGEPPSVVAIFNDITEIRQIERMKSTFVSTVSHELRTPLTSIKGFITTLMDDTDELYDIETRQEFYEIINSECDRLTRLITDLLNVSRIEAGRGIELHLGAVSINEIVDSVIENQRAATAKHTIIDAMPDEMPSIVADADKVYQIIENIVSNAIRYSPEGGDITITGEDEGATIKLSVTDQGIGIPPEHRDKIFHRFHKVPTDDGDHGAVKGTGIGLYLVQHLARAHGDNAEVWLEHSEMGKGSTFSIRLPKEPSVERS